MAPTDITFSALTYAPPSTANLVVATLTTTDENAAQTFTYTVVGGTHAASFTIANTNQLVFAGADVRGSALQVTVRSTDSGTPPLFFDKTVVIDEGACCGRRGR